MTRELGGEPDACLEVDVVLAFVDGELTDPSRRAVEAHADRCADCRRLLSDLARVARDDATTPGAPDEATTELSLPSRREPVAFGDRWRITGRIGKGGMGEVFRAVSPTGEVVAIKRLEGAARGRKARSRFVREASLVRRLAHPNVVNVFELGKEKDDVLYLVMECLQGEDLASRLRRGELGCEEAARIGIEVAKGLGAAHAAGIVHRDVKPSNVFLCEDGSVKVLDFGVALVVDAPDERLTLTDQLVGTPAYMAVEQARGSKDVDLRADVWGLGATLYRAVAGRPPFSAPSMTAQLVRIATGEPDPMPANVPAWLEAAVMRALEKDREARWPSMEAFGAALQRGLAGDAPADHAGGMLLDDGRPPPSSRHLGSGLAEEVRMVAILFAERVEDEAAFASAVTSEAGAASPLLGGRAVAIFGGERWHGDEPERAVRAGLAVRKSARGARLGVATGRGVRAPRGKFTGAVVAAAAGALADEGVGTDEATRNRIRGAFVMEGGAVVARRPGADAIGVRGIGGADVPQFGRETEMAYLRAAFAQTLQEGQAAGIVIEGHPGLGKSRLAHAFLVHVSELGGDFDWMQARCDAGRSARAWHPFEAAIRRRCELAEDASPEVTRAALLAACPTRACAEFVGEVLGAAFPETPELRAARADPKWMKERVVLALGELFDAIASRRPLVLVVEDAHWADPASVELVDVLVRRLVDRPLFVLVTTRTEIPAIAALRRLALGPLSRQATASVVRAALAARRAEEDPVPLDDGILAAIHERSGGNPYFAEELALGMIDGPTWAEGTTPATLPSSIESAVQARLDGLSRQDKDLLRLASVLGRRFEEDTLAALAQRDVGADLAELRRRELLGREVVSQSPAATWSFRHAVVQEVAYGSLTDAQRASLHRKVGQWLAARAASRPDDVARHLERGGQAQAAVPFWIRAADLAFEQGDARLGLEASARALEAELPRDVAYRLRSARSEALFERGRTDEAGAENDASERHTGSPADAARVLERRCKHARALSRFDEARALADEALRAWPDDAGLSIEAARVRSDCGQNADARTIATRALELARAAGDRLLEGRAHASILVCNLRMGDVGAALQAGADALARLSVIGAPSLLAPLETNVGCIWMQVGRYDRARESLQRAVDLCRGVDNRRALAWALHNLGLAQARGGDPETGAATERRALDMASGESGGAQLKVVCSLYLATILIESHRPDEALATLDGLDLAAGSPPFGPWVAALRASALVDSGRLEEARTAVAEALAHLDESDAMTREFDAQLFLAAHAAGVPGALARGAEAVRAHARDLDDPDLARSYLEAIPPHRHLLDAARAAGLA